MEKSGPELSPELDSPYDGCDCWLGTEAGWLRVDLLSTLVSFQVRGHAVDTLPAASPIGPGPISGSMTLFWKTEKAVAWNPAEGAELEHEMIM